jgi:hypothetical protein
VDKYEFNGIAIDNGILGKRFGDDVCCSILSDTVIDC